MPSNQTKQLHKFKSWTRLFVFYILEIQGAYDKFPDFFVWAFKIVIDSWKFTMLHLRRWLTNFDDFRFKWAATAAIGIYPTKPDYHSWWISKMQSGYEDTLEEWYAIKFCFKLGKNDATETYGMLQTAFGASCMNQTSVFEWQKRFKEGRELVRDNEGCERSKEVNTPELIGQTLRVTMLRF